MFVARPPTGGGFGVVFTDAVAGDGAVLDLSAGQGLRSPGWLTVEADLGIPVRQCVQVHGRTVVDAAVIDDRIEVEADAIITDRKGIGIAVRTADCLPIALADAGAGLAGVVHAGRVGLLAGVIEATLDALVARGATSVEAWIGPGICGSCYEVSDEMAAAAEKLLPGTRSGIAMGDVLPRPAGCRRPAAGRQGLHRGGGPRLHLRGQPPALLPQGRGCGRSSGLRGLVVRTNRAPTSTPLDHGLVCGTSGRGGFSDG